MEWVVLMIMADVNQTFGNEVGGLGVRGGGGGAVTNTSSQIGRCWWVFSKFQVSSQREVLVFADCTGGLTKFGHRTHFDRSPQMLVR